MAIYCRQCGLSEFHTSRFRFQVLDLAQLLLLRLPVRCTNCYRRTYTWLPQFLELRRAHRARHRQSHNAA
jgi:hypothetical protein